MALNWTIFKKKKNFSGQKKQAVARKEGFFGPKIGKKLKCKGKKLSNFPPQKKRLFGPKRNKLGLSLKRKNGVFRTKNWEKFEYTGQKLNNLKKKKNTIDRFQRKKGHFGPKKQAGAELKKKKWFPRELKKILFPRE